MKNRGKQDLCQGPIFSGMFLYMLPVLATGLLQVLYNAADTMVIGQFAGDESLAAVASTASLTNLLVNMFLGISSGILTVVARHIGAKHRDAIHQSIHTAVPLALVCGVFLLFVGVFLSKPILAMMGTGNGNVAVLNKASLYMKIYFMGSPAFLVYNFGSSILRAAGDTKRPLIFLTISGITNVVLNLLTVVVFHMDVAGVALATIASQYVSAALVLRCLLLDDGDIRFEWKKMRFYRRPLSEFLRLGIPAGVQSSMFSISNVLMQSTANTFGVLHIAGAGAAGQIENIMYTLMTAINTTVVAFTGQNFGAHNRERIQKVSRYGHLINALCCLVLSTVILLLHRPLLGLFTSDPVAMTAGRTHLIIIVSGVVLDGVMQVVSAHLRGLGFSIVPMLNALFGTCAMRVAWVFWIFPLLGSTWTALYICYPVTWVITACAHLAYALYADKKVYRALAKEETA